MIEVRLSANAMHLVAGIHTDCGTGLLEHNIHSVLCEQFLQVSCLRVFHPNTFMYADMLFLLVTLLPRARNGFCTER